MNLKPILLHKKEAHQVVLPAQYHQEVQPGLVGQLTQTVQVVQQVLGDQPGLVILFHQLVREVLGHQHLQWHPLFQGYHLSQ